MLQPTKYIYDDGTTFGLKDNLEHLYYNNFYITTSTRGDEFRILRNLITYYGWEDGSHQDEYGTYSMLEQEYRWDLSSGICTFFRYEIRTDLGIFVIKAKLTSELPNISTHHPFTIAFEPIWMLISLSATIGINRKLLLSTTNI